MAHKGSVDLVEIDRENKLDKRMREKLGIADKPSCPICGTEITAKVCRGCGRVL